MSRIENALGKISLDSVRRKKAGLDEFEHPLITREANRLKAIFQLQEYTFLKTLAKIEKGSLKEIADEIKKNMGDVEPIFDVHIKYLATHLLENNKIFAKIENETIIYSIGHMSEKEYIDFYKKLIPLLEKRGVKIKQWVKDNIHKKD